MREDRKDTSFEDIAASPFEQTWIAPLAENRLVDFTRPLLLDNIRFNQFAVNPHPESADRRVLWQRKMKHTFQSSPRVVHERLFDCGSRNLVANLDLDLVETHGEWRVATVDIANQRTDRFVVRRAFETGQPDGLLADLCQLGIAIDAVMRGLTRFNCDGLVAGAKQFERVSCRFAARNFQFATE